MNILSCKKCKKSVEIIGKCGDRLHIKCKHCKIDNYDEVKNGPKRTVEVTILGKKSQYIEVYNGAI